MKLVGYASLWQWNGQFDGRLEQVVAAGFGGVEYVLPADPGADRAFGQALRRHRLGYIAQAVTRGPVHADSLRATLERCAPLEPVSVTAQSGADSMPFDRQLRYFEQALRLEEQFGIPVAHETHRGRALYTPWHTAELLRRFPQLKLGADFSHWGVACERMPELSDPDVRLAASRAIHVHGRIGTEETPQVADPRAPECAAYVERFDALWLAVAAARRAAGAAALSFTPEFGPAPYAPLAPYTCQPLADIWELNCWMLEHFRARFDAWMADTDRAAAGAPAIT